MLACVCTTPVAPPAGSEAPPKTSLRPRARTRPPGAPRRLPLALPPSPTPPSEKTPSASESDEGCCSSSSDGGSDSGVADVSSRGDDVAPKLCEKCPLSARAEKLANGRPVSLLNGGVWNLNGSKLPARPKCRCKADQANNNDVALEPLDNNNVVSCGESKKKKRENRHSSSAVVLQSDRKGRVATVVVSPEEAVDGKTKTTAVRRLGLIPLVPQERLLVLHGASKVRKLSDFSSRFSIHFLSFPKTTDADRNNRGRSLTLKNSSASTPIKINRILILFNSMITSGFYPSLFSDLI